METRLFRNPFRNVDFQPVYREITSEQRDTDLIETERELIGLEENTYLVSGPLQAR